MLQITQTISDCKHLIDMSLSVLHYQCAYYKYYQLNYSNKKSGF